MALPVDRAEIWSQVEAKIETIRKSEIKSLKGQIQELLNSPCKVKVVVEQALTELNEEKSSLQITIDDIADRAAYIFVNPTFETIKGKVEALAQEEVFAPLRNHEISKILLNTKPPEINSLFLHPIRKNLMGDLKSHISAHPSSDEQGSCTLL